MRIAAAVASAHATTIVGGGDSIAALEKVREAASAGKPLSVGLLGNAADVFPELARRKVCV